MSSPEIPAVPVPPPPAPPSAASAPPPRRRTRRWLAVLLCVLIFLAGSVAGAGAMALYTRRRVHEAVRHPEVIPERIVSRLRRPLELDAEQELLIHAILARRQASLLEARAEALRRAGPEFDGIEADIAAVLRPDQQDLWRKLYERFLRDWVPRGPTNAELQRMQQLQQVEQLQQLKEMGYLR